MTKWILASVALATALGGPPVHAGEEADNSLLGTWRITSLKIQTVGQGEPKDVYGPHPQGYVIFTPEHRLLAFLAAADRKPASNDAEAAALLRSMLAYTGKFKLEPGKWTTTVEFSSTQVNISDPQVRYYTVDGDKLTVRTPEQNSMRVLGERTIAFLTAEREK